MYEIAFTIPGEPQGKARPRVVRSKSGAAHTYTPDKTVAYEELVRLKYSQAGQGSLEGPLHAAITAWFAAPKSASKKKREEMLLGNIRPTKKPDCDNIAKIILDALNGIAYTDDSQVVSLSVSKRYSGTPRVEVSIGCTPNGGR